MRFVTFYIPTKQRFLYTVKETIEEAWEAICRFLKLKREQITDNDCKIVADLEIKDN
jgi:hypothetical protein